MRGTLTAGLVVAALLAGCGGGDGGGGSSGPAKSVAAGAPVTVSAFEYRFEPGSIVVKSGSKGRVPVEIRLKNAGATAHDLRIRSGDEELGGTPIFGPGETKSAKVTLGLGSYEFFCSVGDHEALGMKGTLRVQ